MPCLALSAARRAGWDVDGNARGALLALLIKAAAAAAYPLKAALRAAAAVRATCRRVRVCLLTFSSGPMLSVTSAAWTCPVGGARFDALLRC